MSPNFLTPELTSSFVKACTTQGGKSAPAPSSHRACIALDLDGTLIHSTFKPMTDDAFRIRVNKRHVYIEVRPGAIDALITLSELCELFVFTSSKQPYATQIVDKIAPFIPEENRFYSDSCQLMSGYSVKNLNLLRRPLDSVVLIDDIMGSALLHPRNIIGVPSWMGEPCDELWSRQLGPMLMGIAKYVPACEFVSALRSVVMKSSPRDLCIFEA
jgi:TFIIF-interacting CTD phosphatase-like protein